MILRDAKTKCYNRSKAPRGHVSIEGSTGGGGGDSIFSSYVGSGPASTVHPKKISEISSSPKQYLKFYQPQKIFPILYLGLNKRP